MKNRIVKVGAVLSFVFLSACLSGFAYIYAKAPNYSDAVEQAKAEWGSTIITDRHGEPLRLLPNTNADFIFWVGIDAIPHVVRNAIICSEDKRFYRHFGFDPIAVARSAYLNLKNGRIKSGASTISQQVVRLLHPRKRTYKSKLIEFIWAVKLEQTLTKEEILELCLNLSPMGRNIRGVGLASRTYFGKSISYVNASEAAALAVLPRSPSRFDTRTNKGRVAIRRERDDLMQRMSQAGAISADSLSHMLRRKPAFQQTPFPLEAPHFVDLALTQKTHQTQMTTTVDLDVQQRIEQIIRSHKNKLDKAGIGQVSVVAATAGDSEILAMVGSHHYGQKSDGFVNGATAPRGAGSTLKPFLYALALEKGYNSTTEISDTFRTYYTPKGDYQPYNADRRWYGPVTIRSALGNSLNASAVKTIKQIGIDPFHELLDKLQLTGSDDRKAEHYGLGLAIGNIEVSLLNLTQAYTALAREGMFSKLKFFPSNTDQIRVLEPEAAAIITNILSDPSARLLTFGNPDYFDLGFQVALKTGTSSNYRDCWIVAYTTRHIVGIWAGNFDGKPINGPASAPVLGPLLKDILTSLYAAGPPENFVLPAGVKREMICWMSGKKAGLHCPYKGYDLVIENKAESETCNLQHKDDLFPLTGRYAQWLDRRKTSQGSGRFYLNTGSKSRNSGEPSIEIVTPHHNDRFILSPTSSKLLLRAVSDQLVSHVTWIIDGMEVGRTPAPYEFAWDMTRGAHKILAVTPKNEAANVNIFVE